MLEDDGRVYYYNPYTKELGNNQTIPDAKVRNNLDQWWYIYAPSYKNFIGTQGDKGKYGVVRSRDPNEILKEIERLVIPNSVDFVLK